MIIAITKNIGIEIGTIPTLIPKNRKISGSPKTLFEFVIMTANPLAIICVDSVTMKGIILAFAIACNDKLKKYQD